MDANAPTLRSHEELARAVELLRRTGARLVGVVDNAGSLIGYVTPENISELVMIGASRDRRATDGSQG